MANLEKTVGILGGMGPEATVDIMKRIIRHTPALDDGDHIHCLIDNDPKVPSRIKALIEGTGENPGPHLAQMAARLEKWGADFLIMPCNTAHYYFSYIKDSVSIPVVHIIDLIVDHIVSFSPDIKQIGVTASTAVLKTGLYEERFKAHGIEVIYPNDTLQDELLYVIKKIKAGDTGSEICDSYRKICDSLAKQGAGTIIVACTELSVISDVLKSNGKGEYDLLDAAEFLAKKTVELAKN